MWHVQSAARYGRSRQQRVDVIVPQEAISSPLVVVFGGNWWRSSTRADLRHLAWDLAEHGQAVAVVDVRLHNERGVSGWADLLADAEQGLQQASEEAQLLGHEHPGTILLGCGSGSVMALRLAERLLAQADRRLRGVVSAGYTPSVSPWEECPSDIADILKQLGEDSCPNTWANHTTWPDLLFLHGDADEAVPATVARKAYRSAHDHGIHAQYGIINSMDHQGFHHHGSRSYHSAFDDLIDWLLQHS